MKRKCNLSKGKDDKAKLLKAKDKEYVNRKSEMECARSTGAKCRSV
jgi:hypothetical protein